MLVRFPYHGFSRECQLLCATTRNWVESEIGTTSFYQLSLDDAYWMLEDMAEYDHWCWNNFNSLKPGFGNQPQETGVSSKLQALFKDFMEETRQYMKRLDEKLTRLNAMVEDSFATLKRIEAMGKQTKELVASTPSKDVPIGYKQDCLLEEYTPCEEHLKVFDDDSKFEDSSSDFSWFNYAFLMLLIYSGID